MYSVYGENPTTMDLLCTTLILCVCVLVFLRPKLFLLLCLIFSFKVVVLRVHTAQKLGAGDWSCRGYIARVQTSSMEGRDTVQLLLLVAHTASRFTAPVHIDVGGKIFTSSLGT